MRLAYIVIQAVIENGTDCGYHIDSVWTSEKKAQKRCDRLNEQLNNHPIFGKGLYKVEQEIISTRAEGRISWGYKE